jgi:arsenate reductase
MKAKIYHNPRCSKSRATLALLQERGVEVEIVDYLAAPPTRATLEGLVRKLKLPVSALVRTNEPEYRALAGRPLADHELIELLVKEPKLLQRPIVEVGAEARIGRPPEQVLELLE